MGDGVGGGGNNGGSGIGGGGGGPGGGGGAPYTGPDYETITVEADRPYDGGGGGYGPWSQYGYDSDWWFDQHYGELIGDPEVTDPAPHDYGDYDGSDPDDNTDGSLSVSKGIVDISLNKDGDLSVGLSKGWKVGATFDVNDGSLKAIEAGVGYKAGGAEVSATISYNASEQQFYLNLTGGYEAGNGIGVGGTVSYKISMTYYHIDPSAYYMGGGFTGLPY